MHLFGAVQWGAAQAGVCAPLLTKSGQAAHRCQPEVHGCRKGGESEPRCSAYRNLISLMDGWPPVGLQFLYDFGVQLWFVCATCFCLLANPQIICLICLRALLSRASARRSTPSHRLRGGRHCGGAALPRAHAGL
jgi:hypothetical protein